jgi:hypothetical protein
MFPYFIFSFCSLILIFLLFSSCNFTKMATVAKLYALVMSYTFVWNAKKMNINYFLGKILLQYIFDIKISCIFKVCHSN